MLTCVGPGKALGKPWNLTVACLKLTEMQRRKPQPH